MSKSQSPLLDEVLEEAIGERIRTFMTALPADVLAYDADTQRATIRIYVTNAIEDSTGDKEWHNPTIQNVQVQFPGGTGEDGQPYRITYPVTTGDQVIYLVSTLPLHEYLRLGYSDLDIDPIAYNNLSSGWVIPGIPTNPPTEAPIDAMVFHAPKVKIGGIEDTEPTFMADTFLSRFNTFLSTLETEVNAILPGAGTTIVSAWVETGIKTTNTEVK